MRRPGQRRFPGSRTAVRSGTPHAIAVGSLLAIVIGLNGCGGSPAGTSTTHATVVHLSGGVLGAGHRGMSATSMPGMSMSQPGSVSAEGAYLQQIPRGSAYLRQTGDHLAGWVSVSGLPPGSHHAEGIRGPATGCSASSEQTPNLAVALPALVANAQGEAYTRIDVTVRQQVLSHGYDITVDRDPTIQEIDDIGTATASRSFVRSLTDDPVVLCGGVGDR